MPASTRLRRTPIPSTSNSTTSPDFRDRRCSRPHPFPTVPDPRNSPATNVSPLDTCAIQSSKTAPSIAFGQENLTMPRWQVMSWIAAIVFFDHYLGGWIRVTINELLPSSALGHYPQPHGLLYWIDTVFGLALVAFSEEVVFRRCARHLLRTYLGDGIALVAVTSVLFGAYHWWTGVGNILAAIITGLLLMLFLQRAGSLWPVVIAHYLTDIADFAFSRSMRTRGSELIMNKNLKSNWR
jgi:uncharacterized protein